MSTEKKTSNELKLWSLIGAVALVLVGLGVILALLLGTGAEVVFEKFVEANFVLLGIAALAVIAGIIGLILYSKKYAGSANLTSSQWTVKELIVGALCIGLAFVLSYIRIWHMPMGGSITPASMLPIILFAYIYGTPKGLIVAVAYGLLQLIQDNYIVHWAQLLLDYVLGFGALALAGFFKKSIIPGVIVGGLARFFFSFLSGVLFFAEYAPKGQSPVVYSILYQATYLVPEIVICIIITLLPGIKKNVDLLKAQALGRKSTPSPEAAK